jgi:hypothetical protein
MKKVLCMAAALAWLSGCASTQTVAQFDDNVDTVKVAAIDTAANRAGIKVVWINYPSRHVN